MILAAETETLWPILVYSLATAIMVGGMILVSFLLGERHRERPKALDEPYESGIVPTGNARLRLTAKFYLIAMFFVIFDLEAVFVFAWVIAFNDLRWAGFVEMAIFIGLLMVALVYLWRQGALDWGPGRRIKSVPLESERKGE